MNTKNLLKFVVFFQYIPRVLRVYPLYREVTRTSGILTETAWAGAAFNLFLYMLASHVSLSAKPHLLLTEVCLFSVFLFTLIVIYSFELDLDVKASEYYRGLAMFLYFYSSIKETIVHATYSFTCMMFCVQLYYSAL